MIPVLVLAIGCTREMEKNVSYIDGEITLYATSGENKTKTILQQDGSVFWSPGDNINVFYGNRSGKFSSNNTEPSDYAEFTGLLGSFVLDGETEFFAAYPYSDETTFSGNVLEIGLPAEQMAQEGTFADNLFICVAKSKNYDLYFYNVCGGVKFSLARNDIKKVVFKGNGGESLAGRLSVEFASDGMPQVNSIHNGNDSVTLLAPDGESFKAGSFYYIVLAPQVLEHGYTMELYANELVEIISSDSPTTVRRSTWGVLKDLASGPSVTVPEIVDLGLPSGLKWASFNLGAAKPEESGDYYAWGETEPYYSSLNPLIWKPNKESGYIFDSYTWSMGDYKTMTKYCTNGEYGYNGFTDGKTVLDFEDDAAHISLGGNWRMPTKEEFDELLENSSWTWTSLDGVYGLQITSAVPGFANQSIFLPAAGYMNGLDLSDVNSYGSYWLSSLTEDHQYQAYQVGFYSSSLSCFANPRCLGFSIRPVYDDGTVTKVVTITPTNIGPCSVEIPFTISTNEVVNNFGIVYSTNINEPVVGNYGDGAYSAYYSSEGNSMIISELKPNTTYYARAFITLNEEHGTKIYGNTIQFTTKEILYSSDYVDIGLSVAWATCNLGSSTPSNVGGYYRWGETDLSSLSTGYIWSGSDGFTKYNATDGKVTLEASDDAASVNLGGKWRMPTNDELTELRNNCTWTPTTQNGVKGSTVTGPNGKSIFIPISKGFSGEFSAEFLSSSLSTYSYDACQYVHALSYRYDENFVYFLRTFRDWGTPIRPVYDDSTVPESSNCIYYTSTDGEVVTPSAEDVFGANIVSNTYSNGMGVISFDGPVTGIGEKAFSQCDRLQTISIPEGCLTIGLQAFEYDKSLVSIHLPSTLKTIAGYSIYGCESLREINLPEGLNYIANWAFCGCTSLEEITIPQSVSSMGGAFASCINLTRFKGKFADASGKYLSDGVSLMGFAPVGMTSFTVPDGIKNILSGVFCGFGNLTEIHLPEGLSSIGFQSFRDCSGLSEIVIPESVEYIGNTAFQSCQNLTSIRCLPTTPPTGSNGMFSGTGDCPIYVPAESVDAYKSAEYWSEYADRIRPVYGDSGTIPEISVPEQVDLGLSVKWASFNLGATRPEESGSLFAWGETNTKNSFSLDNYKWYSNTDRIYTKYNWLSEYGIVDYKYFLDAEDDAAQYHLGGEWRMPTEFEIKELISNCNISFVSDYQGTGISGCIVRSNIEGFTDNSLFIPSGEYISSSLEYSKWYIQGPYAPTGMLINESDGLVSDITVRDAGQLIRPVFGPRSSWSVIPGDLVFGEVPIGTTSIKSITVTNTGDSTIKIGVEANSPFSMSEYSLTIIPGDSKTIEVSFSPTEKKEYQGLTSIVTQGMGRPWINVFGTGI